MRNDASGLRANRSPSSPVRTGLRGRGWLLAALGAVALCGSSGCYYWHLGAGQARLMLARESATELRESPETPEPLRRQLDLVERVRRFAQGLDLEVGGRYTSYVDWPGDRVITTVVATRPGQVEARGFDFPIVGKVPYKGFFDLESARAEASALEAQGLDVCLVPVTAYSTLGWLDDPLTAPMIRRHDDTRLVETVLHELVHATVFVESQPSFNEGIARFIGQEAAIRFFADDAEEAPRTAARVREDRALAARLLDFRRRVESLYDTPDDEVRIQAERDAMEAAFRNSLAEAHFQTREASRLAERVRLNDACLAISGTYAADDALHARVFESVGRDLRRLVDRLRSAAEQEDPRSFFFEGLADGAVQAPAE